MAKTAAQKRASRKRHIRKRVFGSGDRPRLVVFKSNQHIYAQIINDETGEVLVTASDQTAGKSGNNKSIAAKVGEQIAKGAKKSKITEVVFDRNGYKYHGKLQALADAARKAGLKF